MNDGMNLEDQRTEELITFLSHRSGGNLLYRMRPDGSELRPILGGELADCAGLADGRLVYRQPHWTRLSPDRSLFLSWACDLVSVPDRETAHFFYMIFLGRTEGGPARVLAPRALEVLAWAPDSRRFAYSRTAVDYSDVIGPCPRPQSTRVVVGAIDGSREIVVLEKPGCWVVCDWSQDGNRLLLLFLPAHSPRYGRSDLIELDLVAAAQQKERMKELRPNEDFASGHPIEFGCLKSLTDGQPIGFFTSSSRYSPDGSQIATVFSRRVQAGTLNGELGVFDPATETMRSLGRFPDGLHGPICWSPDGAEILVSRPLEAGDHRENLESPDKRGLGIWAIRADGTSTRFLTTGWRR